MDTETQTTVTLWTSADVAREYNVTRQAVSKWAGDEFDPLPLHPSAPRDLQGNVLRLIFDAKQVRAWVQRRIDEGRWQMPGPRTRVAVE